MDFGQEMKNDASVVIVWVAIIPQDVFTTPEIATDLYVGRHYDNTKNYIFNER